MARIRSVPRFVALTALLLLSGCSSPSVVTGIDASAAGPPTGAPSVAGSSTDNTTGSSTSVARVVAVAGRERTFRVDVPVTVDAPVTAEPGQRVPVLIMLHGAGGNAASFAELTGMSSLAERWGFVVVYPDGTQAGDVRGELAWNAEGCCGAPARAGIDDVAFIQQVITDVETSYPVDHARVFVAGFSNGGMLSYRLACELGDRIAGIADVAGADNVTSCDRASATAVLIIHGTADTTVPYNGGETSPAIAARFGSWSNASVADAVSAWRETNSCGAQPTVTVRGTVTTTRFEDCATSAAVELVASDGGTHRWPTVARDGWAASERIVQFFDLDR